MSKTYEALKRAEALRAQERAAETFDVEHVPPTIPLHGADDYYELRRALMTSQVGESVRSVLVVSSLHGEGTSSVACLLARAIGGGGRTRALLVDLNLRTPALWRLMNVSGQAGFMNVIAEDKRLDEVIQPTDVPGVAIVTAGNGRLSAVDVIDNPKAPEVVEGLARLADVTFIDAPPVTLYPDARALAPLVDGVILVIEADATPVGVASRATEILRESGANILGVVLNKTRQYIPERFAAVIG
ncbi:MAG TPA: CpsD/CapB family tyrosine-protein kinase [Candidatus Binatia bacterium]|jgi:capsular exopolysaccharide synthesis family protein